MLQNLFLDFPIRVQEYLGAGSDSMVFRAADGNVLKLTTRQLEPEMGKRRFDLPILESGVRQSGPYAATWFVQPEADSPIGREDFLSFLKQLRSEGYQMHQPGGDQLGYWNGQARLLDPFAVRRIPECP